MLDPCWLSEGDGRAASILRADPGGRAIDGAFTVEAPVATTLANRRSALCFECFMETPFDKCGLLSVAHYLLSLPAETLAKLTLPILRRQRQDSIVTKPLPPQPL